MKVVSSNLLIISNNLVNLRPLPIVGHIVTALIKLWCVKTSQTSVLIYN